MSARRRHKKNHEAARLAEATLLGEPAPSTRGSAPADAGQHGVFSLRRPDEIKPRRRQRNAPKLPAAMESTNVMVIGRHEVLAQEHSLPASSVPGQSSFHAMFQSTTLQSNFASNTIEYFDSAGYAYPEQFVGPPQQPHAQSRHHRRRIAQHFKWRDLVIPSLVTAFLAQKYDQVHPVPAARLGCDCGNGRRLTVALAEWEGASKTSPLVLS